MVRAALRGGGQLLGHRHRRRPPPLATSPVDYRVADLLDPPAAWAGAFDPDGPWPLTRAEVESFAAGDLELVRLGDFRGPDAHRWRAELQRTGAPPRR